MSKWINQITNRPLSRRAFLRGSALATIAVAGLSLNGCSGNQVSESASESSTAESARTDTSGEASTAEVGTGHAPAEDPEEGGTWLSAACWHNCGGRCVNKVLVKDGAVIRQKTDDTHEDSYEYPQQRGCVRGKAQQQQCFGADRLRYPMKRKNWSPENPNGELRGKDEWERISWEEAIRYVADQVKATKEKYGNGGFLGVGNNKWLRAYGGFVTKSDTTSHGTYNMNVTNLGLPSIDSGSGNDRTDMLNADTIILYSSNPAWSTAGTPSYHYLRAKEAGVKFITVDPIYTASAQMLDATWIPVRTGTDTAFLLGVASEMLRLDEEQGDIVDWEFLDKYTVGFDADHKPADLKEDVNFLSYLKGEYDGVPKTAEWASEICGAPVEKITFFAEALGKKHNVWFMHNYGAARCYGSENLAQIYMTVGLMGGHIAKPGNCTASSYHAASGNSGPALVKGGSTGLPGVANPLNATHDVIPALQMYDAIFSGKYRYSGMYYATGPAPGEDRTCDIHLITHDGDANLQTAPYMKRGIEAHRAVDFVVSKAQFLTTNAKYSDIVLPVTTEWETPGAVAATNREFLFCYSQVTEPLYEAKTDQEIDTLLMEALDLDPATVYPISQKQQFFNAIAGSTVIQENGDEFEPLVTITADDIKEWGVEGEPQEGRIGLQEFIDNGGYQVERKDGDRFSDFKTYSAFIEDPEANPLPSVSGKFEITCQAKADLFNAFGYSDRTYQPYPEYIVSELGYETTFKDGKIGGEKGEYPYLLFNPHYLRRSHSVFNNCPWLREAWPNPVFLNASDAKEKKIKTGDTVKIWTPYGEVLRKACCMESLMPGHVGIPHGAWSNVDEETGIDKGGADNYLMGHDIYGSGVSGYNNCNCNFEKYDGEELEDDCYTDSRIIDLD